MIIKGGQKNNDLSRNHPETSISSARLLISSHLATAGMTSVAAFVCLDMVESTREGENRRGGPPFASSPSTRLKEEEQADFVSPTCSREQMKGDISVDPTERPNSKFMVPSQHPALILVAPAIAAEDPGRKFPAFTAAPPWRSKLRI